MQWLFRVIYILNTYNNLIKGVKNELDRLGYDFSKYHHISLIGDINKDTTFILFDAAVPFYNYDHGKKRILSE